MRFRAFQCAASFLLALICFAASGQSAPKGTDLSGRQISLLSSNTRIAVLFFIASDCPISNRYQPEMLRLKHEYEPRGVTFWFIYPNLTETTAGIKAHQTAFTNNVAMNHALIDPTQQLTQLSDAKVTPQAAILSLDSKGKFHRVYAGRIDDLYLSIGNERPQATHHDLELALNAVLAGSAIPLPTGPPVGCGIVSTR